MSWAFFSVKCCDVFCGQLSVLTSISFFLWFPPQNQSLVALSTHSWNAERAVESLLNS